MWQTWSDKEQFRRLYFVLFLVLLIGLAVWRIAVGSQVDSSFAAWQAISETLLASAAIVVLSIEGTFMIAHWLRERKEAEEKARDAERKRMVAEVTEAVLGDLSMRQPETPAGEDISNNEPRETNNSQCPSSKEDSG